MKSPTLATHSSSTAVSELVVDTDCCLPKNFWRNLLSGFPNLDTLQVSISETCQLLFQVLDTSRKSSSAPSTQMLKPMLCPQLTQLLVHVTDPDPDGNFGAARAMFAAVRARAARGAPLRRLEVTPVQREFRLIETGIQWVS